jgi:hypothetical protein
MPDVPPRVFEETHIKKSTYVRNKMVYCIVCHSDEALSKKYNMLTVSKAHDFLPNQASHWETVRCVDCHSSYLPPNLSTFFHQRRQLKNARNATAKTLC